MKYWANSYGGRMYIDLPLDEQGSRFVEAVKSLVVNSLQIAIRKEDIAEAKEMLSLLEDINSALEKGADDQPQSEQAVLD